MYDAPLVQRDIDDIKRLVTRSYLSTSAIAAEFGVSVQVVLAIAPPERPRPPTIPERKRPQRSRGAPGPAGRCR